MSISGVSTRHGQQMQLFSNYEKKVSKYPHTQIKYPRSKALERKYITVVRPKPPHVKAAERKRRQRQFRAYQTNGLDYDIKLWAQKFSDLSTICYQSENIEIAINRLKEHLSSFFKRSFDKKTNTIRIEALKSIKRSLAIKKRNPKTDLATKRAYRRMIEILKNHLENHF